MARGSEHYIETNTPSNSSNNSSISFNDVAVEWRTFAPIATLLTDPANTTASFSLRFTDTLIRAILASRGRDSSVTPGRGANSPSGQEQPLLSSRMGKDSARPAINESACCAIIIPCRSVRLSTRPDNAYPRRIRGTCVVHALVDDDRLCTTKRAPRMERKILPRRSSVELTLRLPR